MEEERATIATEAMLALTELSPSEHHHLQSVQSPRPAISKAFEEGRIAAVETLIKEGSTRMTQSREALGSLDPRPEIEDCKAEVVEALHSLDPRPVLREAVEGGRTSTREAGAPGGSDGALGGGSQAVHRSTASAA